MKVQMADRALRTTECQDNHSVTGTLCVLASLPQPDLEVRSLRNAARQYPCARPFVLSPRAARRHRGACPGRGVGSNWIKLARLELPGTRASSREEPRGRQRPK